MPRQEKMFDNQRSDEEVVYTFKKHWLLVAPEIIKGLLGLIVGLALPFFEQVNELLFSSTIFSFAYALWMIFWGVYILYHFINWHNDKYLITNQRIIEYDRQGAFSKRVSEVELDRVDEIYHEVDGFFPTMFNFGVVFVRVPSATGGIAMEGISNPGDAQEALLRLIEEVTADPDITARELIDYLEDKKPGHES